MEESAGIQLFGNIRADIIEYLSGVLNIFLETGFNIYCGKDLFLKIFLHLGQFFVNFFLLAILAHFQRVKYNAISAFYKSM